MVVLSYPYTYAIGNLKKYLNEVPSRGIPEQITQKYLESIEYKSKNDRRMIPILKFINLINSNSTPNENYEKFRDLTISKKVMGSLIKEAYSNLYRDYPNADSEDDTKLKNWFSTKMGVGDRAAKCATDTFKVLCSFTDFQEGTVIETDEKIKDTSKIVITGPQKEEMTKLGGKGININVNIEIVLPTMKMWRSTRKSLRL